MAKPKWYTTLRSPFDVPQRALWLRALMLERESVTNHLGALGALGNDGGLGFGLAQTSRMREVWQRRSGETFGHGFMMDCVLPGGVVINPTSDPLQGLYPNMEEALKRT